MLDGSGYNRPMNATAVPTASNPLAEPRLWNEVAPIYSKVFARHLARYGEDALTLAGVTAGSRVVDVACGPGTLSLAAARRGATVSALDFSVEMIRCLQAAAEREELHIDARVGNGMELPFADDCCGAAFSMFGLIFFPDRARGFRELLRVLKPGGYAVVGSWAPVERVPMMNEVYSTLCALVPNLPFGSRRPLSNAEEFHAEMCAAGFSQIEVREATHELEAASVEDFWNILESGTPPFRVVREKLGEVHWAAVRRELIASLKAKWGEGTVRVAMIANLGIGRA